MMNDKMKEKYFKDGETAQHTLEEIGEFENMGKQYILTQNWDRISEWISMREAIRNKDSQAKDYRDTYKSIQIPITEEDLIMFEELLKGDREPFMWTFDKVNVEFIKDEEEE